MGNLQASPSSSTTTPEEKYDVFINFRGTDIRDSFANTLREALKRKHIKAFMDDESTKGESISQLFKTIEESKISIVIFSEDYGSSEWCLNELVKIMERKKINKQTVLAVFYRVKPSAVRDDSFVKLKEKFPEEVPKWKEALIDASRLQGWDSSVTRPDTILINSIVDDICKRLTGDNNISSPSDFKGLIGIGERIKQVKSLLCLDKTDVRIIGLWGMGGIGKTTLAEAIFKQIPSHQFGGACLIQDVKDELKKSGGLDRLQKNILSKVLNDKNLELDDPTIIPQIIKKRLNQAKVFIVLDDVDDFMPLETLAAKVDGLGQGSRIIITSRDKQVLRNCGVNDSNIYEVEEFNRHEALQLFYDYAFKQNHTTEDLKMLSNDIVNYAKGNPLALKVLGSSLNQKSKKAWESAVNKLRTNVDRKILDVLKISYDGLNSGEQEVFLDIACFLRWENRDYVAAILDDCDYSLSVLIDKSLITISYGYIDMHDLLQDLGRDIVRKESPKNPGQRSRLWTQEDVLQTLKHDAGTSEVQGVFLDMFNIDDMHLRPEAFEKMFNLRLLKFYDFTKSKWDDRSPNKVQFREGLNNASFDKMRSFIWHGYPLTALSSKFNIENLVELDMRQSNLERLWEDTTHAPKLRWLSLDSCLRLTEIPDLSKSSPLLEKIDLRGCLSLTKISNLSKLLFFKEIDLNGCSSLTKIPDLSKLPLLEKINLNGCSSLTNIINLSELPLLKEIYLNGCSSLTEISNLSKFPLLEKIDLDGCSSLTEIINLSESPLLEKIDLNDCRSLLDFPLLAPRLKNLHYLKMSGCERLRSFPSNIHFESLTSLHLNCCSNLTTFPRISGNILWLDLSGTAIDEVPPSIENLIALYILNLSNCTRLKQISTNICKLKSLKELYIENCSQLERFPEILDKMESLKILNLSGTTIKELPHSIENLNELSTLYLSSCINLMSLPSSIYNLISLKCLDISDCSKLEIEPEKFGNLKSLEDLSMDRIAISQLPLPCSLTSIYLNDCNLKKIPEEIGRLSSLECLELSGNDFESLPKSMKQLNKLKYLEVDNCNMLQSFTELPSALKYLSASGCNQLQSIPDASEFANLAKAEFIFTNCLNLEETAVGNMLASLMEGYEESDKIGELTFCCPGSKFPGWLDEGPIVEINSYEDFKKKSKMAWHVRIDGRRLAGFVVCAVIAFEKYCIKHDLSIRYKYELSDGDESSAKVSGQGYISVASRNGTLIDSDHMAFGFCKDSVPRIRESDFSNCSFEFWLSDEKNPNCRIKSFGVCPIYT